MSRYTGWIVLALGVVVAALYFMFRKPTTPGLVAGSTLPTNPLGAFVGNAIGAIDRDISTAIGSVTSFSTSVSQPGASGAAAGAAAYAASKTAGPGPSDQDFQDYVDQTFGPGIDASTGALVS